MKIQVFLHHSASLLLQFHFQYHLPSYRQLGDLFGGQSLVTQLPFFDILNKRSRFKSSSSKYDYQIIKRKVINLM